MSQHKINIVLVISILTMSVLIGYLKVNGKEVFKKDVSNWQWSDNWHEGEAGSIAPPEVKEKPTPPSEQVVAVSLEDALEKAKNNQAQILAIVTATWCSPCKELKSKTLSDKTVREDMKKYIFLELDADKDISTVRKLNVVNVPSYVIMNQKGEIVKSGKGLKNAKDFSTWLN